MFSQVRSQVSISGKLVKNIISLGCHLRAHLTFKPHLRKEGRKDKMQVLTENSNLQWLGTRQLAVRAILPAWFDPFLKKKQEQNKNNCLHAENHIETPYQPCYLMS